MQPLISFWNKLPSNPGTFEQERPQKPGHETVSALHPPKNDILTFFKFMQKKVSRVDNKAPAHFYTILGVAICKNHVGRPLHSFNKCRKFLLSSLETFFCRNLKNGRMSFLGRCNVETVSRPGFQGLSCSKVAGFEGGVFQKLLKGIHFQSCAAHFIGPYLFSLMCFSSFLSLKCSYLFSLMCCSWYIWNIE